MPGDLHTHTTYSDGSTPVDKLPFLAACAGMTHLAVSDHDSIQSVRYAYAHPVQNGVHLIPATELTAYDYERAHRVHLLCYWPDDCAPLADFAAMMAERRLTAMLQSCKELEQICPQFRTEEALELARDSGTLFKAQVMRVLWQYGLADGMYNTVYKSLFGLKPVRGRILHTPRYEPVDTVLEVIKASRAVVVLAHPSVYHSMELARELEGKSPIDFPRETAMGALALYISDPSVVNFQPMNVNFGLIPPLGYRVKGKRNKNAELSQRSLAIIEARKEEILS